MELWKVSGKRATLVKDNYSEKAGLRLSLHRLHTLHMHSMNKFKTGLQEMLQVSSFAQCSLTSEEVYLEVE